MKKICSILLAVLMLTTMLFATAGAEGFDVELNPGLDYLILVNDEQAYEFGGEYDKVLTETDEHGEYVAMVMAPDVYGDETPVEKATYAAFVRLQGALAKRGLLVQLYSGYWSEGLHESLIESHKDNMPTIWKLPKVGHSDHNTGLTIWVYIWDRFEGVDEKYLWGVETQERSEAFPQFAILHELLPDYGFIDRYPLGKEEWTGTQSEPFEIRFVGSPEVAHAIVDNGLCLEEYLEMNK